LPDYNEPLYAAPQQADWQAMLHELEKRVEVLGNALDEVKLAVRRIATAEPWAAGAYEAPAPYAVDEQPAQSVQPSSVEYDDDAREAVRRAVEEAKAQMARGEWDEESFDFNESPLEQAQPVAEWYDESPESKPDEQQEVLWLNLPEDGSAAELTTVFDGVAPRLSDDEDEARDAVRRAVEDMRAEMAAAAADADDAQPSDNGASETVAEAASEADDEEAREAVRRAVEQLRAEMAEAPPDDVKPIVDDEEAREAVRRAVEEAKAEMSRAAQPFPPEPAPIDEEEAAREAVRRAVQQARTEIATTGSLQETPPEPVEVAPAYIVPPPSRAERVHPPTITIEDPEGRVELARVYNLLKALDCAANSSLLNYSARQVSVQLNDNHTPDGLIVSEAVKDVFEREPEVQVDGANVIVKLGTDYIRAA
jgi:hypothetical protein